MKKLLIDTNFLIHCVKQKIDLFEYSMLNGFEVLIPKEVIDELNKLESENKNSLASSASLVKKVLNSSKFENISIKEKYVDKGIIQYLKDKPEIILATLDKELQGKVKNSLMIIRQKKKLEIVNR